MRGGASNCKNRALSQLTQELTVFKAVCALATVTIFLLFMRCPSPPKVEHECPKSKPCPVLLPSLESQVFQPTKFSSSKKIPSSQVAALLEKRKSWGDSDWEAEALRLVDGNMIGRFTIISAASVGHLNFTLNWIASLKINQYDKFLVFCMDAWIYRELIERGFVAHAALAPKSWTLYDVPVGEHKWKEDTYSKVTEIKIRIQAALLQHHKWFLFSDTDVVFLSPKVINHITYMLGTDCLAGDIEADSTTCLTDMLYMNDWYDDVNTGFFAIRPTSTVIEIFKKTIEVIDDFGIDQLAFNHVIRDMLKLKFSRALTALDKFLYPNGEVYILKRWNEALNIRPLVFHANYAEGSRAKIEFFVSAGFWYLED